MQDAFNPVGITASGLALETNKGPVYGPVDLDIAPGETVALIAGQGSGLSSLLLTLAGRMKPSSGSATIGDTTIPGRLRKTQRIATFAGFEGLDDLDTELTIGELVYERISLESPLIARRPGWDREHMLSCRRAVFGEEDPTPDIQVFELSTLGYKQVQLLLACVCRPSVICFNDVDALRNPADQTALWQALIRVSELGITVVANTANRAAVPEGVRIIQVHHPNRDHASSAIQPRFGETPRVPAGAGQTTAAAGGNSADSPNSPNSPTTASRGEN